METLRNSSLLVSFLLAFLIITSEASQATRMTEKLDSSCNTAEDCTIQNRHCPPGLIVICASHHCTCIH
ncbi:LCR-like protein [Medicago truncatula]|uniref:LCR-like protein n=1 Tax=Medicago truncatula TaxID=3880 RepID=A0A072UC89_MEDTR|nr:LCR-like protein [Medicago truncatula]